VDAEHVVKLVIVELDLRASFAVSSAFGLEVLLPLRFIDLRATNAGLSDRLHHRPGGSIEPGDVEVSLRWRAFASSSSASRAYVDLRAGAYLPSGPIPEDPASFEADRRPHEHVALNGGGVHPMIGLQAALPFSSTFRALLFGWARLPISSGVHGFEAGPRFYAALGVEHREALAIGFTLGAYHEGRGKWRSGVFDEGTGQTAIVGTIAATIGARSDWPVEIAIAIPVELGEGPVEAHSAGVLSVSLQRAFEL
jgi:hypothetical protein